MELKVGQLIVMLTAFVESESYGTVKMIMKDRILINVKGTVMIPKYSEVLCIVVAEDEMFEFYSTVEDIVGDSIFINYTPHAELSAVEKRKFNRIDCDIGFVGNLISYHGKSIIHMGKRFTGIIKNISAGGVMTQTNLDIPEDMEINFKLKLNYFMDCTAIVKRSTKVQDNYFQAGCQFMGMNLSDVKEISMFVFKHQLKIIQKDLQRNKMRNLK